ncbi:MAG: ATP-dependent RNA helicase [Cercozoa sp. M6MM]
MAPKPGQARKRRRKRSSKQKNDVVTETKIAENTVVETPQEPPKKRSRGKKSRDVSEAVETPQVADTTDKSTDSADGEVVQDQSADAEVVQGDGSSMPASVELQEQDYLFSSLGLHEDTTTAVERMGFEKMTSIQARAVPPALAGRDILGAAKTGSGKTMAFLLPIVELMRRGKFKTRNGTGAIIIVPTRELAIQVYGVLQELLTNKDGTGHTHTHGVIMGGANRRTEAQRLMRGVSVLVATPGRLFDHLENTDGWNTRSLSVLAIDEADRILENGFEDEMKKIVKLLPRDRQTLLFSATQTKKASDLARLAFREKPVYIGVDDNAQAATRLGLSQGYVVCPSELRFRLLFSFLKRQRKKKVIVFMSTCAAVTYFAQLLNFVDLPVLSLHGKLKQKRRTATFFEFCNAEHGTLITTDVAARGLDIPRVDWIIQFDPPEDPRDYIHRVGRTARGQGDVSGKALLFLRPSELAFLKYLKQAKVPLNEFEFPSSKIANVQSQLERLVSSNFYLQKAAKEAYRSYMQSYSQQNKKDIFDIMQLKPVEVAKSFGFNVPPKVHLNIRLRGRKRSDGQSHGKLGFSEKNPYGRFAAPADSVNENNVIQRGDQACLPGSDQRQFAR